jgi:D-alanyl-D-alanine carboxypeptidase (penicillin-binding protein 5/6)
MHVVWLTAALSAVGLGFGVLSLSAPSAHLPAPPVSVAPQPAPPAPPVSTPAPTVPPPISDPGPAPESAPRSPLLPPVIHAASSILIDAVSGQVLYEKNADVEHPMASTTKIMTALLFCENVPDDAIITASKYACSTGGSSLHLKPGEKISGSDLLHAILMRSANDGCVAAAEHIAGSEAAFVEKMNAKARELGALHTHFANPHGLNAPDHYTTARDLAAIARAAIAEPRFSSIVRTQFYRINRSKDKNDVTLRNHSHFLGKFDGADGIKTGWTVPAGHCYVGSATQHGWRLLSVVLHSPDYVHETIRLMKFGFSHFAPHVVARAGETVGMCPVKGGVQPEIPVTVRAQVQVVTRKDDSLPLTQRLEVTPEIAPVASGEAVGTLAVYHGAAPAGQVPVVALIADPLPPVLVHLPAGSPWKSAAAATTIFAMGLVSLRYGTRVAAFTKSARRRGRRLAKSLRGNDNFR